MRQVVLLIGATVLMTACNRGSTPAIPVPTLPTPSAPQAVYTGTITDSVSGAGTLTMTLGTAGSIAGGTWAAVFPGQRSSTQFVTGTVNGTSLTVTVSCSSPDFSFSCFPDCRQAFTGTMTANGLSGTYAEVPGDTCTPHSGSVSTTRQ